MAVEAHQALSEVDHLVGVAVGETQVDVDGVQSVVGHGEVAVGHGVLDLRPDVHEGTGLCTPLLERIDV